MVNKIYTLEQNFRKKEAYRLPSDPAGTVNIVAAILHDDPAEAERLLWDAFPNLGYNAEFSTGWFPEMAAESVEDCATRMGLSYGLVKAIMPVQKVSEEYEPW